MPPSPGEQLLAGLARDPDAPLHGDADEEILDAFLVFRIGPHWYAVGASSVGEVVPYSRPVPIPGVPTLIAGVVNLGGRIVAVLDLSVLLGLGRTQKETATRCVVLQVEGLPVCVVPDEVAGLLTVRRGALQPATEAAGLVDATFTDASRLVTVLAPQRLLKRAEAQLQGEDAAWSS